MYWRSNDSGIWAERPTLLNFLFESNIWDQIFTARVRSTTGGYIFTLFTIFWGGGTLFPGLGRGVPHSQVQMGGYPIQLTGGYPIQLTGGGTPSSWWGIPPSQAGGTPLPEQHRVCLLRGVWYASCFHAGGLSCLGSDVDLRRFETKIKIEKTNSLSRESWLSRT